MKFWFTRKGFRESREAQAAFGPADGKTPFDATVEQTLRAAQAINDATSEPLSETPTRDVFDIFSVLRESKPAGAPDTEPPQIEALTIEPKQIDAPSLNPAPPQAGHPTRIGPKPGPMRAEVERRAANYRAFQMKLNEDREARIRKTMADVRSQLQQLGSQGPQARP